MIVIVNPAANVKRLHKRMILYICRSVSYICIMKKEAYKDQTEDHIYHVADIHILTSNTTGDNVPSNYHYHNCFEIIIVQKGCLKIMANYMLREVKEGDIVMLRNNLPHEIISHTDDYKLWVIHIPHFILPQDMEEIPELCNEYRFVKDSQYGYLFSSPTLSRAVIGIANKMRKDEGFMRICHLFRLLHLLSESDKKDFLVNSQNSEAKPLQPYAGENAIDRTYRYLYRHYTEEHTLDEIAAYANQNKTALCRVFKKTSGYTIFQFIHRLRIEKACKLIKSTSLTISMIAIQVGYKTFSYFSMQFQGIMKMSPTQYRRNEY